MSEPKTALDLAKKWEASSPIVCARPGGQAVNLSWGHKLATIPADAVSQIALLKAEVAKVKEERDRLIRERAGEVWLWQGDGEDHPESLGCPVLMHPEDVRKLTAARALI